LLPHNEALKNHYPEKNNINSKASGNFYRITSQLSEAFIKNCKSLPDSGLL